MNIGAMRIRVAIQKNTTGTDKHGNHRSGWVDYFRCWATISQNRATDETNNAGHTQEHDRLNITVRWSSETAAVNAKEYRILMDGRMYNIVDIDELNYKHNARKFVCVLQER